MPFNFIFALNITLAPGPVPKSLRRKVLSKMPRRLNAPPQRFVMDWSTGHCNCIGYWFVVLHHAPALCVFHSSRQEREAVSITKSITKSGHHGDSHAATRTHSLTHSRPHCLTLIIHALLISIIYSFNYSFADLQSLTQPSLTRARSHYLTHVLIQTQRLQ